MKNLSKIFSIIALLLVSLTVCADGKKSATADMKYDIVSAGVVGTQGTVVCKVNVYSKNGKTKDAEMIRAAVHGIIFKGMVGGNGIATQRPMADPSMEYQKADFFNSFFADGGPYMMYANMEPTTIQRAKVNKEYRVSAVVTVNKDELRKFLEKSGIIKSLGSMF